jgi:hypothetical protein
VPTPIDFYKPNNAADAFLIDWNDTDGIAHGIQCFQNLR